MITISSRGVNPILVNNGCQKSLVILHSWLSLLDFLISYNNTRKPFYTQPAWLFQ